MPDFPPKLELACLEMIIRPALHEMGQGRIPFRGILFAGLMLTEEGAKLIEFNVRFGDPECQVLLARLKSDLLPALQAACDGELRDFDLRRSDEAAVAVVMAARGYPDAPERGSVISGLRRGCGQPGRDGVPRRHGSRTRRGDPGRGRAGADHLCHRGRRASGAGSGLRRR